MPNGPGMIEWEKASEEKLARMAYQWICNGLLRAPVPKMWRERIAALCGQFAWMLYGALMQENEQLRKALFDAAINAPPPVYIVKRSGDDI